MEITQPELTTIRIGARDSRLSLRQVDLVAELLGAAYPGLSIDIVPISTKGDRDLDTPLPLIGGKGLFTEEIELALLSGRSDLAVHSLKDLPTANTSGIVIGAIPRRASAADLLVANDGVRLADLPPGARIGTSSPRRATQLVRYRSDFQPAPIRGNVETRLRKGGNADENYHAIVLAAAGIDRLRLTLDAAEALPFEMMLPAPGQGALAVQCRREGPIERLVGVINDGPSALAVTAERAFLDALGGGCSTPIAALGVVGDGEARLSGRVLSPDGRRWVDVELTSACTNLDQARELGSRLAELAVAQGADALLQRPSSPSSPSSAS
jgi:hydroxymethylbilane synthase